MNQLEMIAVLVQMVDDTFLPHHARIRAAKAVTSLLRIDKFRQGYCIPNNFTVADIRALCASLARDVAQDVQSIDKMYLSEIKAHLALRVDMDKCDQYCFLLGTAETLINDYKGGRLI
jgi:hypothetical protein